jgi:tripartite-type tricarboxylate transporter receptor subunit TctC
MKPDQTRLQLRDYLRRVAGGAVLCVLAATAFGDRVHAQTDRTVKIVVPFAAGGGADILARLLAEQVGRAKGPTFVVENRPGAGTVIGTSAVARAEPDGNTLLMMNNSLVVNPHLRKLTYDPLTSFDPICLLVRSPQVIVVNSASPYHTLADLLDAARSKPGELTMASIGPASTLHIAIEMLKKAANVNMTFVPYKGTGPSVNALLGQHVTSVFSSYAAVSEQIKAGKLRALAVASRERTQAMPSVPTIAEAGYKGIEVDLWYGLFAPAKTPREAISQLGGWFGAAVQAPEVQPKLLVQGLHSGVACGSQFAAFVREEHDKYGAVIREANITVK